MNVEFGSLEMVALVCLWLSGLTTGVLLAAGVSPVTIDDQHESRTRTMDEDDE